MIPFLLLGDIVHQAFWVTGTPAPPQKLFIKDKELFENYYFQTVLFFVKKRFTV